MIHAKKMAAALVGCVLVCNAHAQQTGSSPADVRYTEFPPITYFHFSVRTSHGQTEDTLSPRVDRAMADMAKAGIAAVAPSHFVYRGADGTPGKEFDLSVGWPVAEGTKPVGDYRVSQLPAFKCAMLVHVGALSTMHSGYEKLVTQVAKDKKETTGESREVYAYFAGPESANNVTILLVGIK